MKIACSFGIRQRLWLTNTRATSGKRTFPQADRDASTISIERQTDLVPERMKLCPETAGSSLDNVLKCNVYLQVG